MTLAATGLLLIRCVSATPISVNCAFSDLALEMCTIVVEDCELVLAEDVRVGVGGKVVRDFGYSFFEVSSDARVEIAFSVASKIDGSLIGQWADTVTAGLVVAVGSAAIHCRRGDGDGRTKLKAFR